MHVDIDVLPGISSNLVLPGSPGFLPVAVLGSPDFSAASIDPSTVAFGPEGAPVARRSGLVDVNGDGFRDIVFTFRTFDTGVRCGDAEASLTGLTKEGQGFIGADQIVTAGCGFFRLPGAGSQGTTASETSSGGSAFEGSQGGQPIVLPVEEIFQSIGTVPSGGGEEQPAPLSRDIWSGDTWSSEGPRRPLGREGPSRSR